MSKRKRRHPWGKSKQTEAGPSVGHDNSTAEADRRMIPRKKLNPVLKPAMTREAVCRVCGQPFIAKRNPSGCWGEICKQRACRAACLFRAELRLPRATASLRINEIDGGGQCGRFRINNTYREWN